MIVALLVVSISSCSDLFGEHDTSYQGPPKVEFTPLAASVELAPGTTETINVSTQLIGKQRGSDLTFGVHVVEDQTSVPEDAYSIPSSVTIPANSSTAVFSFEVTADNFAEPATVAIQLEGTDNVQPAEKLKTFTLTISNP